MTSQGCQIILESCHLDPLQGIALIQLQHDIQTTLGDDGPEPTATVAG